MVTETSTPRGWRVRIAILWGATLAVAGAAMVLLYDYGRRVAIINQAYLDSELQQDELRAIDDQWLAADLITRIAAPLLGAALLLAVLTLAIQARGWQLTRERARVRRADPLAH